MIRTIAAALAAFVLVAFSARAEDKPADAKADAKKTEKKAKKSKKAKKADEKPAAAAPAK